MATTVNGIIKKDIESIVYSANINDRVVDNAVKKLTGYGKQYENEKMTKEALTLNFGVTEDISSKTSRLVDSLSTEIFGELSIIEKNMATIRTISKRYGMSLPEAILTWLMLNNAKLEKGKSK